MPQTRSTPDDEPCPSHTLVASIEEAHGVADVNHVAWCTIAPKAAARKLRELQGDSSEGEEEPMDEGEGEGSEAKKLSSRGAEDPKWGPTEDMFASAGDDGIVRVWTVGA